METNAENNDWPEVPMPDFERVPTPKKETPLTCQKFAERLENRILNHPKRRTATVKAMLSSLREAAMELIGKRFDENRVVKILYLKEGWPESSELPPAA